MARSAIPAIVLSVLVLTGCASGATGDLVQPKGSDADSTNGSGQDDESPDASDIPEAEDGTDVDACFDGSCEIEITHKATIPLDKKFDVDTLEITVESGVATADITFVSGGKGTITLSGAGGVATANNLTLIGVAVEGDTAILELSAG